MTTEVPINLAEIVMVNGDKYVVSSDSRERLLSQSGAQAVSIRDSYQTYKHCREWHKDIGTYGTFAMGWSQELDSYEKSVELWINPRLVVSAQDLKDQKLKVVAP
jgi:hypothetical protein